MEETGSAQIICLNHTWQYTGPSGSLYNVLYIGKTLN